MYIASPHWCRFRDGRKDHDSKLNPMNEGICRYRSTREHWVAVAGIRGDLGNRVGGLADPVAVTAAV